MHHVRSSEEASKALVYFNHFHDSFLESMIVNVTPQHPDGFGFALPVRHDLTLVLVHSNYPGADRQERRSRRIEMRLTWVRQMSVGDIVAIDNMLQECRIEVDGRGSIRVDVGGDGLMTFVCDSLTIRERSDQPGL